VPARTLALLLLLIAGRAASAQDFMLGPDDRWSAEAPADPASPEGQLERIRRALAAGEHERAQNLASQWIDRYRHHEDLPTAYVLRGDAKLARRNEYEALYDYELVARQYAGSEAFVTALERELEIATLYARGTKRKLWGIRWVDASDEAQELLIRIQERMPGSSLAEQAGIELGDFYFRRREMALAAEAYDIFIENNPRSRWVSKARRRLIYAQLASFKGPEWDASGLAEARVELQRLIASEPATAQQIGGDALLQRIDESHAAKLLSSAKWYLQKRNFVSAEYTIRRLLHHYPRTATARDALRLIPQILPRLPQSVLAQAPDYETYRQALLGEQAEKSP
jgi:outer membrane protein assembly factor BamD (BamD/ComL family)